MKTALRTPEGMADFHVSAQDGCSSLLSINRTAARGTLAHMTRHGWKCAVPFATRRVPVVSLGTVIGRWLRHLPNVSFIKVDAQGYDLHVAQSAGMQAATRIGAMRLEVTRDAAQLPNDGAVSCTRTVQGMRELGFSTRSSCNWGGPADHNDFTFVPVRAT